jgi:hypothetical protein
MNDTRRPDPIDGLEEVDKTNWDDAVDEFRNGKRRDHDDGWTATTFRIPSVADVIEDLEFRLVLERREEETAYKNYMDYFCTKRGAANAAEAKASAEWREKMHAKAILRFAAMERAIEQLRAGSYTHEALRVQARAEPFDIACYPTAFRELAIRWALAELPPAATVEVPHSVLKNIAATWLAELSPDSAPAVSHPKTKKPRTKKGKADHGVRNS